MNVCGWVPMKLYLQKTGKSHIWPAGCNLPTSALYHRASDSVQVKEKYMIYPQTFNRGKSSKKAF